MDNIRESSRPLPIINCQLVTNSCCRLISSPTDSQITPCKRSEARGMSNGYLFPNSEKVQSATGLIGRAHRFYSRSIPNFASLARGYLTVSPTDFEIEIILRYINSNLN
ncbi:MAG: hypothetical protein LBR52_02195 [Prevotellaceae bacterium]|nr:hypothetical protein [Prevotellaceae bacterium]